MRLPLVVLSIGAVFAGWAFADVFIGVERAPQFWRGAIFFDEHLMHARHAVPELVKYSATIVMLLGLFIAWLAYIRDTSIPARFTATFGPLYRFLLNKWYWDELYNMLFVRPAFALGRLFWKRGDEQTINRFGPDGAAWVVAQGSRGAVRLQSGYLYTYALIMLIGLAAATTWAVTR
jgi:NADH-quinone oxidoreductase subunit L